MGASKKERGVLKLVHPGKHVEYHRSSITAAEIMSKNPRHSITRPDFFKNPHIVVRPESVMVPGQVFYIVPNNTVYKLVKCKSQQLDHDQDSPSKALAGRTPFWKYGEGSSSGEENTRGTLVDDSDSLTFQARDYYQSKIATSENYGQQGTNLKSCMKKEGRMRVSQNLRVAFDFSTMIKYCI